MSNKIPSSVIEITEREDLRVGDIATFNYQGHEFTGEVWSRNGGTLIVGSAPVLHGDGAWSKHHTFVRAFRPAPSLPTEPGAVILITECRGERVNEPVVAVRNGEGTWWSHGRGFDGCNWHGPEDITEWTLAKVVPA